jgi:hypothetical protein
VGAFRQLHDVALEPDSTDIPSDDSCTIEYACERRCNGQSILSIRSNKNLLLKGHTRYYTIERTQKTKPTNAAKTQLQKQKHNAHRSTYSSAIPSNHPATANNTSPPAHTSSLAHLSARYSPQWHLRTSVVAQQFPGSPPSSHRWRFCYPVAVEAPATVQALCFSAEPVVAAVAAAAWRPR